MSFFFINRGSKKSAATTTIMAYGACLVVMLFIAFGTAKAATPSSNVLTAAPSSEVYNVIMHYGNPRATTVTKGSQSEVLSGKVFKVSTKYGQLVAVKGGKGVRLKLIKSEKIVNAYYTYWYEGQNQYHQHQWNGKGVLPTASMVTLGGYPTLKVVSDVFVLAYVPHHPPYSKVKLKK